MKLTYTQATELQRNALVKENERLRKALRDCRQALLNLRQEGESRYVPIIRTASEALGDDRNYGLGIR